MAATIIYHPTFLGVQLPWFTIGEVSDEEISAFIPRPGKEVIQISTEPNSTMARRGLYGRKTLIIEMPIRPFKDEEMLVIHGKLRKEK